MTTKQPSLESLSHPRRTPSGRRRIPAWSIPALMALGFGVLFLVLFGDRLLPAPMVNLAPVIVTPLEDGPGSFSSTETIGTDEPGGTPVKTSGTGEMLFQASGWVEPDPLPVKATALQDGVVSEVHVLEGQEVVENQALVSMVDDDANLALDAARERHRTLRAAREAHLEAIESAERKHEAAVATEMAARTLQDEAEDQHRRLAKLRRGSVSEAEIVSARLRFDREKLRRDASEADRAAAAAEISKLEQETKVRDAEVAAAEVSIKQAELAVRRTRVASPLNGRVLRLLATPGQKKMLGGDDPDSATIAILYEPGKLQVRVDVPLADAGRLRVGQRTRIHCALLPDRVFHGELTRIGGEADIQRNTLQAKVRIIDPEDRLRPEMLCRVEFLGAETSDASTRPGSLALWVRQEAISNGTAWVYDPETRRVSRRTVVAAGTVHEGHLLVTDGLRAGEMVVLGPTGLHDGKRVNPASAKP